MRRTQIQLDEATHAAVRKRAYEEGKSMASVIRETLADSLGTAGSRRKPRARRFRFVGIASRDDGPLAPVSERHDEALAEAIFGRFRR